MPLPLVPLLLGGGVITAYLKITAEQNGVMTPKRQAIYQAAINSNKLSPEQLDKLAVVYAKYGLITEADMLTKRANLRRSATVSVSMPDGSVTTLANARRLAFKKLMHSNDKDAVLNGAKIASQMGATGMATKLMQYASTLK